jgi:hypothetical protein
MISLQRSYDFAVFMQAIRAFSAVRGLFCDSDVGEKKGATCPHDTIVSNIVYFKLSIAASIALYCPLVRLCSPLTTVCFVVRRGAAGRRNNQAATPRHQAEWAGTNTWRLPPGRSDIFVRTKILPYG